MRDWRLRTKFAGASFDLPTEPRSGAKRATASVEGTVPPTAALASANNRELELLAKAVEDIGRRQVRRDVAKGAISHP